MIAVTRAIGTSILLAICAYLFYKWIKGIYEPKDISQGTSRDLTPAGSDRSVGADKLRKKAEAWARSHDAKVVGPVDLEWSGLHAHFDFAVVGWFGVLGVTCLGYGGTIYGTSEEPEWTQDKNGARSTFANPIADNQTAARVLRGVLLDKGMRNLTTDTAVVFTGLDVELALPRSVPYCTADTFIPLLRGDRFTADKGADVEALCALLRPEG